LIRFLILSGALLAAAMPALAEGDLKVVWRDGLRIGTEDGSTEVRLGTRVQSDWVFQKADDDLVADLGDPLEDGNEFRRLYLELEAILHGRTELRSHIDMSGGRTRVRDVWVGLRKLPTIGTVRLGHQYEPMGFDEQTSDRFLLFAERALPMALVPSRNTGILTTSSAGRVTWAAMVARDTDDNGQGSGSGDYHVTGRLAGTPWQSSEGSSVLHVGVSGSRRNPAGDVVEYAQRPENHLAPELVATGEIAADGVTLVGAEGALTAGPVTIQTEWVQSSLEALDQSDPTFSGWYLAGAFFLTGESRPYSRSSATFGRVKPKANWGEDGGLGAWEISARFSRLDLDDSEAGVAGGKLEDVTVGLGWFANPYFRTLANWVHADLEASGSSDALIVRAEANF
jgi:phosphate-selective porin OprO/OprP